MATTYTVTGGDTLSAIARRYGTTVSALLEANPRLTTEAKYKNGSVIFSGTKIRIPDSGGTTSGGTTSSTTSTTNTTTSTPPPVNTGSVADWRRGEEASMQPFQPSPGYTGSTGRRLINGVWYDVMSDGMLIPSSDQSNATPAPTPTPTPTPTPAGRMPIGQVEENGLLYQVYNDGSRELIGVAQTTQQVDPAILALQEQAKALQERLDKQQRDADEAAAKAAALAAKPKPVEYYRNPTTGELILGPDGKPIAIGPGGSSSDVLAYFEALRRSSDAKSRAGLANTFARRQAETEFDTLKRKAGRDIYSSQKKALNELAKKGITAAPGVAIAAKRAAGSVPLNRRLEALQQYNTAISTADLTLAEEQAKADEAARQALIDLTRAANIANELKGGSANG